MEAHPSSRPTGGRQARDRALPSHVQDVESCPGLAGDGRGVVPAIGRAGPSKVVHVGSAALGLEPGGRRLVDLMGRPTGGVSVVDPNVRRDVVDDWPTYLEGATGGRVRGFRQSERGGPARAGHRHAGRGTDGPRRPDRRHPRRGRGDALSAGRAPSTSRRQRRGRRHDRRRRHVHGRPLFALDERAGLDPRRLGHSRTMPGAKSCVSPPPPGR